MTWPHVIIFAVIAGVYTGLINQVPFLYDTSFRDIATYPEWWALFGFIIATNGKSGLDSALKAFVFFLISQPMVYLVELPSLGFELAWSYWTTTWLPMTFLTFPAGFIAYYATRQNALGAAIVGLVNLVFVVCLVHYVTSISYSPLPHHVLSMIACVAMGLLTLLGAQRTGKTRAISVLVTVLLAAAAVGYLVINRLSF